MTIDQTAEKLYGADDTETATKSTHPNEEAAAVMYAPDPRREFSRGDEQTFTARREEQLRAGVTPDELLKYDRDFADWAGKTGLEPHITRRFYNAAVDADLAELRGVAVDEAENQRTAEATRDEIYATYGAEDGARWLERTNEWVKKNHPKLHALLGRRGIGSRKDIVIPLLEHVRRIHLGLR
jgi:hypothetical protein